MSPSAKSQHGPRNIYFIQTEGRSHFSIMPWKIRIHLSGTMFLPTQQDKNFVQHKNRNLSIYMSAFWCLKCKLTCSQGTISGVLGGKEDPRTGANCTWKCFYIVEDNLNRNPSWDLLLFHTNRSLPAYSRFNPRFICLIQESSTLVAAWIWNRSRRRCHRSWKILDRFVHRHANPQELEKVTIIYHSLIYYYEMHFNVMCVYL